jgi:hypothetical protein
MITKPTILELANEPFEVEILGQTYKIRAIGIGYALATLGKWVIEKQVDGIKDRAKAFDDPKEIAAYTREELRLLPRGDKLVQASLDALCGDSKYIETSGAEGVGPVIEHRIMKDLISRGFVGPKEKRQEFLDSLDYMPFATEVKTCLKVLGFKGQLDNIVIENGGEEPEKKDS